MSTQPFLLFTNFVFDDANLTYWKINSSWRDSHRAQRAYCFKTEAPSQHCNKSWWKILVKIQQFLQNNVYWERMLTATKPFTSIRWRRFKSRIKNIHLSLHFLNWKEHNEFHLSFCRDIWKSYFSHNCWNSVRGWCVGRKNIHGAKSGIYQNYLFCILSRHQTEL